MSFPLEPSMCRGLSGDNTHCLSPVHFTVAVHLFHTLEKPVYPHDGLNYFLLSSVQVGEMAEERTPCTLCHSHVK